MSGQSVAWLALLVVLLAIELFTLGLTTIWFAGGALAAFLASLFGADLVVQVILFVVISVLLLVVTRPWAIKYVNKSRVRTNADSLIGQTGVVKEEIRNLEGKGQVTVNGMEWTARTKDDSEGIAAGQKVRILEIRGVKLIVEPDSTSQKGG